MDDTSFSIEDRILCSDGACIGLVGSNGLCKVCGKAYEGDLALDSRDPAEASGAPSPGDDAGPTNNEVTALKNALEREDQDTNGEDERICCADEMCIGIIGENGVCGTCGKPL